MRRCSAWRAASGKDLKFRADPSFERCRFRKLTNLSPSGRSHAPASPVESLPQASHM